MQIVVSDLYYICPELNPQPILEDISFTVERQDLFGIIGTSGAGKTTLGQLLAGLIEPSSGGIRYISPKKPSPLVGMVFQNPEEQFFEETLASDARAGLVDRGWDTATMDENIKRAFAWVGLGKFLHRSPFSLSGGEKRLAAIACVLSADPDIVILDEPTAGLDLPHRRRMCHMVRTLNRLGKTVCIISHDLEWIAPLVNRLLLMRNGKALYSGETSQLFSHPELIDEASLKLPEIPFIMEQLKKSGLPIHTGVMSVKKATEIIVRSFNTQPPLK